MSQQEKLYEQINALIELQTNCHRNISELLVNSEKRIDRTNKMVNKLSDAVSQTIESLNVVSKEYCTHLDKAIKSRDEAQKQNVELAQTINNTTKALLDTQEQNRQLLNFVLNNLGHIAPSAATITVNQQPA